jgi:hypothetical protein
MGLITSICWLVFGLITIAALFVSYERKLRFSERSEERKAKQVSKDYEALAGKIERLEERVNKYMIGRR